MKSLLVVLALVTGFSDISRSDARVMSKGVILNNLAALDQMLLQVQDQVFARTDSEYNFPVYEDDSRLRNGTDFCRLVAVDYGMTRIITEGDKSLGMSYALFYGIPNGVGASNMFAAYIELLNKRYEAISRALLGCLTAQMSLPKALELQQKLATLDDAIKSQAKDLSKEISKLRAATR